MSAPVIQVELGFAANAALSNVFVLNDNVKGTLNSATYLLGDQFVDVSQWLSCQLSMQRGRSRETDQYQAGTLSFTLRNEDRRFDPSNTASPYYPNILPRAPVKLYVDGVQVFGGYVNDLTVNYEKPNICTVDVSCLDGFCIPANTYLFGYTVPNGLTGTLVNSVLGEVGYPGPNNIAVGNTETAGATYNDVLALDTLQTAARTENGYLLVDRTGTMAFYDRHYLAGKTSQATLTDTGASPPTVLAYQAITQKSQSLLLYNQVTGTRNGGTQQVANNAASKEQYLPRQLLLGELVNLTDADVLDLCEYLVGRYSQPDVRFDTVGVELQSLSTASRELLLGLDLVDLVTVQRTPPGSGSPTTITKIEIIDGISLSLNVSSSSYTWTAQLGSVDSRGFFILDDPIFGVLGSSKLSY